MSLRKIKIKIVCSEKEKAWEERKKNPKSNYLKDT